MRIPRRRTVLLGVALVAAYLVALGLTVGLRTDHVRPLYDGFAPPPAYRWVEPPSFFESGNVEPAPVSRTLKLGPDGSAPAGIATPDGQFVINLGRGAIAPRAGTRSVAVKITPVAPSTLAAIPDGLRANGNAYRVALTYEPGHTKVGPLAKPGSLVLEIPELGDDLFASPNGRRWTKVESRTVPPRQLSLAAALTAPGTYVGGTNLPELVAPDSDSSDDSVVIGVAVAALAAIALTGVFLVVRRRRRRTAAVNSG